MKTTFTINPQNDHVTIGYTDGTSREFYVDGIDCGYIKDASTNKQVCEKLSFTGSCLYAKRREDLPAIIRKEYKAPVKELS